MALSLVFGLIKIGGWSTLSQSLPPSYFNLSALQPQMRTVEMLSVIIGFIAAQALVMGILASKDTKAAINGAIASAIMVLPIGIMCAVLGMIARVIYGDTLPHGLSAGPAAILAVNPWIAGLAFCGLWAAIISSGPACALALVQLAIRDIYVGVINPTAPDKKVLFYSRTIAVVISILAFVFSLILYEVLTAVYWAFAIRAGVGVLILMITYLGAKRVNEKGAFWGLVGGLVVLIYWTLAGHPFGIHEFYPMILTVVLISLIVSAFTTRKVPISEHFKSSFDIK